MAAGQSQRFYSGGNLYSWCYLSSTPRDTRALGVDLNIYNIHYTGSLAAICYMQRLFPKVLYSPTDTGFRSGNGYVTAVVVGQSQSLLYNTALWFLWYSGVRMFINILYCTWFISVLLNYYKISGSCVAV